MERRKGIIQRLHRNQDGAALITVILVSLLLVTACAAMLSAVGASAKNNTDALTEAKAYWAAESGLQAAIKVLRNDGVSYSAAIGDPDLSTWLGDNPIVGTEASYSLFVRDPDQSGTRTIFNTSSNSYVFHDGDDANDDNRTEISFVGVSSTTVVHPSADANPFGRIRVQQFGTGGNLVNTNMSTDYSVVEPRAAFRTVRGTFAASSLLVSFNVTNVLLGSTFRLCTTPACAAGETPFPMAVTIPASGGTWESDIIYVEADPIAPYRLVVESTGRTVGTGAIKKLEGIIQKDFFNNQASPAPLMLQGSATGLTFDPGNSSQFEINGTDDGSGVIVPSVGVVDPDGLDIVLDGIPNNNDNVVPAPAVVTDVPDWMATPQNLDSLVSQLRQTAQNSGRYFLNPQQNLSNVGNYSDGTGITFCEGNCTAAVDGGGILVVTGTLRNVGGWRFRGLIIITGADGWLRNGGGNGVIEGNVVIAPYSTADLTTNIFSLPPQYEVTGAGTSDIEYDAIALDNAFNGTSAISNFMLGIAEK